MSEFSRTVVRGGATPRVVRSIVALALLGGLAGCADEFLQSHEAGPHLRAAETAEASPSGVLYSLPAAHVPMTITRGYDGPSPSLSLEFGEPIVYPDPDHTYVLSYTHDSMSTDEITVQTTPEGLLTLISTTTRDQSHSSALGIVRLVGELAKAASPLGPGAALLSGPSLQSGGFRERPRPFSLTVVVNPAADDFSTAVTEALEKIGVYDVLVERSPGIPKGEKRSREELAAYCRTGACYRRAAPIAVQAFDRASGIGVINTVLLPNEGAVGRVDFQRRAFVENVATAHFEQGMLTELRYSDPSETAAAVNSPVEVVQSILSIPSAIWQSDSDTLNAERDLLATQGQLLDERARLLEAQERYRRINEAIGPPAQ